MARPEEDEPTAAPETRDAEEAGAENGAAPAAEEAPAQPVQEPVEEDWTEPEIESEPDPLFPKDGWQSDGDPDEAWQEDPFDQPY